MNFSAFFADQKSGRIFAVASYVAFGMCLVLMAFWGIKAAVVLPKTHLLQAALKVKSAELAVANRDLKDLRLTSVKPKQPLGNDLVQKFQADVEASAHDADCTVTQFSSTPVAIATGAHYSTGAISGYGAFHVRISLTGNLSRVFSMLQHLSDVDVPFEFTNINFSPTKTDLNTTETVVSAQTEVDVLSKSEGA